jgi:OHCU decarboxylase
MGCSVFVNGRGRPAIMEDMRLRIARGDVYLERREAIKVNR